MNFRRARKPTVRWTLWVFVAALVLRAAMPLLASASAEARGLATAEVCSVYGVAMMPMHHAAAPHQAPDPQPDHAGDHCTLSALAALASPALPALAATQLPRLTTGPPRARRCPQAPDACATWVARRKHGPPVFA